MAPGLMLNLLFFLFVTMRAGAQETPPLEVTGAVGGVAFLNPRTPQNPSEYSQIHWRFGEWENQVRIAGWKRGEQPRYPPSPFQGRLELLDNLTLKMSDLRLGDSGEFRLYLEDDTGKESVETVLLKVYALVPKPHVTATINGDPQLCNATLNCSVALQGVTYRWISPRQLRAEEGAVLRVSFDPAGETYVCKVSNAVSSSNASLTFRPPCSWTGESSSVTCATPSALVALGHLVLLFLLLLVA